MVTNSMRRAKRCEIVKDVISEQRERMACSTKLTWWYWQIVPRFLSVSIILSAGKLDANIYIYGSLNGWKVNDIKLQSIYGIEDITYGVNVLDEVKNRWSPANPMGTLPGVAEASSGVDPKKSDFFLERLGICVWIMCQSVILSCPMA